MAVLDLMAIAFATGIGAGIRHQLVIGYIKSILKSALSCRRQEKIRQHRDCDDVATSIFLREARIRVAEKEEHRMIIGIVGSRRRLDKQSVINYVDTLDADDIVVSGGCRGVDTWAVERARERGLEVVEFKPNLDNITGKADMVKRYYARNKQLAEFVDILVAFVAPDRKGGTENTIKYAKKVIIK